MTLSNVPANTHHLGQLCFADAVALGQAVRLLGRDCGSQQEAAEKVVSYLYDTLRDGAGSSGAALVRCFQTHPFAALPPATQAAAEALLGAGAAAPGLRCLALLGTRGDQAEWNQPETSQGHRAIPLPNVSMIERAPMIAGLLAQMGVDARHVVQPTASSSALLLDADRRSSFNVFHVEDALGSSYIPAQQTFVERHGIRSVVGMGGLLPSGELFAVIVFAKVPVSRETAALFRTLALSVKLAFLPFPPNQVFPEQAP